MDLPDSLPKTQPAEYLYHYTSIAGISGIVNSRSLWMTEISYLNDTQEFLYALSLFVQAVSKRRGVFKSPNVAIFFQRLFDVFTPSMVRSFCVFSLSQEPDLLSQWRGYCTQGTGYSVGFKSDLLIPLLEEQELLLAPCVYEPSEQRPLIETVLGEIEGNVAVEFVDPTATLNSSLLAPFEQIAPFIKHPKFNEEKEWRIVTKDPVGFKKLTYRVGRSMLIPYLDAKIDPASPDRFPIKRIVVGPSADQGLAMNSLTGLFAKSGFEVQITPSQIPYRSM